MENMILIDLETLDFSVSKGGIYEVGAIAVSNYEILEKLHLGIVIDPEEVKFGYGRGYEDISYNDEMLGKFKDFLNKYDFPLVAHNAPFDKKFLTHFNWIDENCEFYDSIRAIKYAMPGLESYSMSNLMEHIGIKNAQTHTALDDTEVLLEILKAFNPTKWIKIGAKDSKSRKSNRSKFPNLDNLKKDFDIVTNIFDNKTIVFTGKSHYSRNELIELAKKAGAISNSNGITKKTDILVVGDKCGSKFEKAQKLGVEIITMDEFHNLVSDIDLD